MNRGNEKIGMGRMVAGVALGALLALLSPVLLLFEIFLPVTVVVWPAVALVALRRWAGRGPALSCAVLMLAAAALLTGGVSALIVLFLTLIPAFAILWAQDKPFFAQLRLAIIAFGVGVLAAVAALYLTFGSNMIERAFGQMPAMIRAMPEEYIAPMMQYMSEALGQEVTPSAFYEMYDAMTAELAPVYQMHMPERLFSGALITALLCAWLSNRMRARRGLAAPGSYVPIRGWALSASTTGGLLLLLAVSWGLTLTKLNGAETVYYAVYGIANVAFAAQTLGSAARRLLGTSLRPGARNAVLAAIGICGWLMLPEALMAYGMASAVFGSRGMLRQRARDRENDDRFGGGE